MAVDLTLFRGNAPYASQLFGVYQPLIGWRAERGKMRVAREKLARLRGVLALMKQDVAFSQPAGGSRQRRTRLFDVFAPVVAGRFEAAVGEFRTRSGRLPSGAEWRETVEAMQLAHVAAAVEKAALRQGSPGGRLAVQRRTGLSPQEMESRGAVEIPGSGVVVGPASAAAGALTTSASAERAAANILLYLAREVPAAMEVLMRLPPAWKPILELIDPMSLFDPETQDAFLSPLGLLQLYRQFFFDLDSFLGPAVAHFWVSPGTTLELIETHQRKTLRERKVEQHTLSVVKRDSKSEEEDELSTRISDQNSQNTSLGISANAGVNVGVFQASASVNVGLNSSRQSSQEVAHASTRSQSEQLSTELRREYKTTVRTVLETEDTSARNYKIANPSDRLINYELRRKMRRIAVQLQHVGAQLCWQVYVDNPGASMGVAELVHVAQREDLTSTLQPPEAPQQLPAREVDITVDFPWEPADPNYSAPPDGFYTNGTDELIDAKIVWQKRVRGTPPGPGYTLAFVNQRDVQGTSPEAEAPPSVSAEFDVAESSADEFVIKLRQVCFGEQTALRFFLVLTWNPPSQEEALETFKEQWADYEEKKARAERDAFVQAARDRVKVAGDVLPRATEDLRAEERSAIFGRLVKMLRRGAADEADHVTVELIRALFDVEKMLYFVADAWWRPRRVAAPRTSSGVEILTGDDKVGWGGVAAKGRDNYLVTENSRPAPRGASLGWLLQLDGDNHRNAFLNSPFVKAVVPVRPGRERAALNWLKRAQVEGTEGLDAPYRGSEPELRGRTLEQAVMALADDVASAGTSAENMLAAERVFETGFDPLEGGFRLESEPYEVFDQWVEVLPTDQLVAVEYTPSTE